MEGEKLFRLHGRNGISVCSVIRMRRENFRGPFVRVAVLLAAWTYRSCKISGVRSLSLEVRCLNVCTRARITPPRRWGRKTHDLCLEIGISVLAFNNCGDKPSYRLRFYVHWSVSRITYARLHPEAHECPVPTSLQILQSGYIALAFCEEVVKRVARGEKSTTLSLQTTHMMCIENLEPRAPCSSAK